MATCIPAAGRGGVAGHLQPVRLSCVTAACLFDGNDQLAGNATPRAGGHPGHALRHRRLRPAQRHEQPQLHERAHHCHVRRHGAGLAAHLRGVHLQPEHAPQPRRAAGELRVVHAGVDDVPADDPPRRRRQPRQTDFCRAGRGGDGAAVLPGLPGGAKPRTIALHRCGRGRRLDGRPTAGGRGQPRPSRPDLAAQLDRLGAETSVA